MGSDCIQQKRFSAIARLREAYASYLEWQNTDSSRLGFDIRVADWQTFSDWVKDKPHVTPNDCEHENDEPLPGGKQGETRCVDCGTEFLLCPGCSEDSALNHAPAIFHAPPLCKAQYTPEEFKIAFAAILK